MQRQNASGIVPFPLTPLQHRADGRGYFIAEEQEQRRVMDAAAAIPLAVLRLFLRRILFCIK
ncbi:hypothetical protein D3C72_2080990 [compost metagenome]